MPQFSHLYSSALDRELGTDDSTRLFTEARRKDAINEGVQQYAILTHCFERRIGITLDHGTQEYNLASTTIVPDGDFLKLAPTPMEFRYTDTNGTLTVVTGQTDLPHFTESWLQRYEPGWQNSSATSTGVQQFPRVTYLRAGLGRALGLWPPPGRGSTGDTMLLRLWYYGLPPTLTADTQVPFTPASSLSTLGTSLPEPYHQAAVHYAAAQLEKLRRDFEASQHQMQQFLGYVTEWQHQHEPAGVRQVQPARSYFSEVRSRRGEGYSDLPLGNYS